MWRMIAAVGDALVWIPWSHLVDIGLMWFLVYHVYVRFRGTQAMRLLVRVFLVWLAYLAAQAAGLRLTSFLLWALWIAVLILFLINFQEEIRRIFLRLNPMQPLALLMRRALRVRLPEEGLVALVQSAFGLAQRRTGAIMILERRDPIEPLLRSPGEVIRADIRPGLLETIFFNGTPYHDGAAAVRDGRVDRVGCVLPLSENRELPAEYGTRHRAAAGLTEKCDALAVVVSEERGEVSAVEGGQIKTLETPEELTSWLMARLQAQRTEPARRWAVSRETLTHNWRPKLIALGAVAALWLLGGEQRENPRNILLRLGGGAEEIFSVPVSYYNIPDGLELGRASARSAVVRLGGSRDILNFLDPGRLRIWVNLQGAREGESRHPITERHIDLPGRVRLLGVDPAEIEVRLTSRPKPQAPPPGG